jgi:hypothetical protein
MQTIAALTAQTILSPSAFVVGKECRSKEVSRFLGELSSEAP